MVYIRLAQQYKWTQDQVALPGNGNSSYWRSVGRIIDRFKGLQLGYEARLMERGPRPELDFIWPAEWLAINAVGASKSYHVGEEHFKLF